MIIQFITANKAIIGEGVAGLVTAASALNRLIPADKGPKWLHSLLDQVAAISKPNMAGTIGPVTIPLLTKSKAKKLPPTETVIADDKK